MCLEMLFLVNTVSLMGGSWHYFDCSQMPFLEWGVIFDCKGFEIHVVNRNAGEAVKFGDFCVDVVQGLKCRKNMMNSL